MKKNNKDMNNQLYKHMIWKYLKGGALVYADLSLIIIKVHIIQGLISLKWLKIHFVAQDSCVPAAQKYKIFHFALDSYISPPYFFKIIVNLRTLAQRLFETFNKAWETFNMNDALFILQEKLSDYMKLCTHLQFHRTLARTANLPAICP